MTGISHFYTNGKILLHQRIFAEKKTVKTVWIIGMGNRICPPPTNLLRFKEVNVDNARKLPQPLFYEWVNQWSTKVRLDGLRSEIKNGKVILK
jgi:hypothetical protein